MLIENAETRVYLVGETKLMPGVNHLPRSEWDKIKTHPHVKARLEAEEIRVLTQKDDAEGASPSLKEFQPKAAERIVKQTFDSDLLEAWAMDEKRAPIRTAIQAQIQILTGDLTPNARESASLDDQPVFKS